MSKIAYILLAHKNPDRLISQIEVMVSAGDYLVLHYDLRAPHQNFALIKAAFRDNPSVRFAKRVACGWGEWSLVQATLNAVRLAEQEFADATHFALISGDCMPIKPAAYIHAKLDDEDCDYIEHHPFDQESDWVKVGLKEERLIYRHYFNERRQKSLFYASLKLQQLLGLKRDPPEDLRVMIGSQWFLLRRSTIEKILEFLNARLDVVKFFKTTWIPDEIFFQTLVMHLVARKEVRSRTQTFLVFSDYGMPVNFHLDHVEMLRSQDYIFARKISENGEALRKQLAALYCEPSTIPAPASSSGRALYEYVREKGRAGKRVAPRFWAQGSTIGRHNELLIIVCKKWHVGNSLRAAVSEVLCSYGYIFDNNADALPPLGNIESSVEKRTRHRRAFLRLVFEYHQTNRLLICLDPSNLDVIRDFASDDCKLRVLEVRSDFDDKSLQGHAQRIGLGGAENGQALMADVLATLRLEIAAESEMLGSLDLAHLSHVSKSQTDGENVRAIAEFLSISDDKAAKMAQTSSLIL